MIPSAQTSRRNLQERSPRYGDKLFCFGAPALCLECEYDDWTYKVSRILLGEMLDHRPLKYCFLSVTKISLVTYSVAVTHVREGLLGKIDCCMTDSALVVRTRPGSIIWQLEQLGAMPAEKRLNILSNDEAKEMRAFIVFLQQTAEQVWKDSRDVQG